MLTPYQVEYINAPERYSLMLAHRRAGKTRAAITAATVSGTREYYVCATPAHCADALRLAQELTGAQAEGTTLALPHGGSVTFLDPVTGTLHGCAGNVTIDEPYDPGVFAAALRAVEDGYRLRIVGSMHKRYGLMDQLTEGGLFSVYLTDVDRSTQYGFPYPEGWERELERQDGLWAQEFLCKPSEPPCADPAVHWYSVEHTAGGCIDVPGVSRADALRVFNTHRPRRGLPVAARALKATMSAAGVLCGVCGGPAAFWRFPGLHTPMICAECAPAVIAAGYAGRALYTPPDHRHAFARSTERCVCGLSLAEAGEAGVHTSRGAL